MGRRISAPWICLPRSGRTCGRSWANINPYDLGRGLTTRVSPQFRIVVDTNCYTVPAHFAGRRVTLKLYPDRVCIYYQDTLIARHPRSYDRRQDIKDPDHEKRLLDQRKSAREQRLVSDFLALSNQAAAWMPARICISRWPKPTTTSATRRLRSSACQPQKPPNVD